MLCLLEGVGLQITDHQGVGRDYMDPDVDNIHPTHVHAARYRCHIVHLYMHELSFTVY